MIGIFFAAYKIFNTDETLSFTDYISRKTSFEKTNTSENTSQAGDDILAEFLSEAPKQEIKANTETPKVDPLAVTDTTETITQTPAEKEEVPDWLKSTFSSSASEISQEAPKETSIPEIVPEKSSQTEVQAAGAPEVRDTPKFDENNITNIQEENIPDWLKGSFTPESTSADPLPVTETRETPTLANLSPIPELAQADNPPA